MKKITSGIGAVVAGLAMLTLSAVTAPAAQRPGYETYVVRRGDTLAKISGRVLGDVKRWREILAENPQVTNANLIFPGDILLLPVPQTAAAMGADAGTGADAGSGSVHTEIMATSGAAGGDQGAGGAVAGVDAEAGGGAGGGVEAGTESAATPPEPPVEQVRPPAVVNPGLYRTAGFIADNLPTIAIVASQDDRFILGTGDMAVVDAPLAPGRRFTVVRADRRVFHPVTGRYLGWLVRILGTAEVTCLEKRTSTIVLRAMNDAASVGDYLMPLDPNDVLGENTLPDKVPAECVPAGGGDGVIVAFNENRRAVGEQELVYIDRGTAAGVTPGRRFTIYREIAPEGRVPVGELQVLRAGAQTSTALITSSVQEVQVGNLLRAH